MRIKPHLNGALLYVCQISLTSRFQPKSSHLVSLHDTFRFCDYNCLSDGITSGGYIWTSGRSRVSRLCVTTGLVFRTCDWLSLSAGVGYGSRTLLWEDSSLNWARVSDRSPRGIAADIALHFRIRSFRLYAGVSTAAFRTCDYEFGLGFCF